MITTDITERAGRATDLAGTRKRLRVTGPLPAAVGQRLSDVAARTEMARQAIPRNEAEARAQIAAAGAAARGAIEQVRSVIAARDEPPGEEPTGNPPATGGPSVAIGVRLARAAREPEGQRGETASMATLRERLRLARDMHDLLGLGLSALALKADLIGALIGRDDAWAAAEIEEMCWICAAVRADARLVTSDGLRLRLVAELAAARRILSSAGVAVRAGIRGGPLPAAADEVLAPVLREAVTNVLRHAAATACVIEVTVGARALRLDVSNDTPRRPATGSPARATGGRGLANMEARVRAAGGRLAIHQVDGQFRLTAELPLETRKLRQPAAALLDGPPGRTVDVA